MFYSMYMFVAITLDNASFLKFYIQTETEHDLESQLFDFVYVRFGRFLQFKPKQDVCV